jgi:glycosyltransferase involved in cell wall biosynthesis
VHIDEEVRYSVRALGLPDDRRIHLYSFSYASFQSRKNPNAFLKLKEIFKAKYEYGTDLFLLVASDLPRNATDVLVHEKLLAGQDSNFYYWPGGRRRSVHTSLIGNSNTFISLHRSEGIGLQLVEAALLRTPIVTHNFSGPSDFILDDDPGIYPWRNKMIFDHEYPHSAGQIWADFQISNVFDEFEKLHTTHNAQAQMQTRIERHFSLEETSRIFAAALKTF